SRGFFPREAARVDRARAAEPFPLPRIPEHLLDRVGDRPWLLRIERDCSIVGDLRQRPAAGACNRHGAGHRLEDGEPEALVERREDEARRRAIEALELFVRNPADKPGVLVKTKTRRMVSKLPLVRSRVTGEHEDRSPVARDERKRLEQTLEILVRALQ